MMETRDIYKIERRVKAATKRLKESAISEANKRLIFRFKDFCETNGLGKFRIHRYLIMLVEIAEMLNKDFEKATRQDIERLVQDFEKAEFEKPQFKIKKTYAESTKASFKIAIKRFYKWFKGKDETYPPEVAWIKTTIRQNRKTLPEHLFTEEEIGKLINAAEHPRDKALISTLYESGCRVGELLSTKINDVIFDQYGCAITVKGKTGMRRIRLVNSAPLLATWIDNNPFRGQSDGYLWVVLSNRNKHSELVYTTVKMLLKRLLKKAGINKRCNPHIFRHSRATYMANFLTEAQMCEYFGWKQGSDMPGVYVHLSGRDVDNAVLGIYGLSIQKEKEESTKVQPKKCVRCCYMNSPTSKFCNRCGLPLDAVAALEVEGKRKDTDELMSRLLQDEEVKRAITQVLQKVSDNVPHPKEGEGKKEE